MTPKQHQFAREVVLGKSQADAYRSAYNTLRMNDNSIRREASRLMDNPNVATTVVELQHKADAAVVQERIASREEVLQQTGKSFSAVIDDPTAVVHDEGEVLGIELWGRIAVRKGSWKLMRIEPPFLEDRWYLYNIDADPRESTDLSEQLPDKLAEMITAWERYRETNNVILPDTLPAPIRPLIRPMWLIDNTPHPDPMP